MPTLPTTPGELGTVANGEVVPAASINDLRRLIEELSILPRTFGVGGNHIQIDPGSGKIAAAGTARATWSFPLALGHTSTWHTAIPATWGLMFWTCGDLVTRGLRASAIIPPWVDVAEDIELYMAYAAAADISSKVLRLTLKATAGKLDAAWTADDLLDTVTDHAIPASTGAGKIRSLNVGTITGGSLAVGDLFHIQADREGGHANDTLGCDFYMFESGFSAVATRSTI